MKKPRTAPLAAIVCLLLAGQAAAESWPPARPLDPQRLAAAGLRAVESARCTLVTDVEASPEVDRLPGLVDLALPQWAERFGQSHDELRGWRLRAYLIKDRARFEAAGLWPNQQTDFPHGLAIGYELWLYDQASDYYRRHLFLHEATHSYMATLLGGCGPGWYMEGMAELCGAHRYDPERGELRLSIFPKERNETPLWGRVGLIQDAVRAGAALPIDAVMRIDNRDRLPPTAYAWAWALAKFLDKHPHYHDRFTELPRSVLRADFDQRFVRAYRNDRRRLDQEWRLFTRTLAYGHDIEREAIDFQEGRALVEGRGDEVSVEAGLGWQSSGLRVEADRRYRITASGRLVIGRDPDGAPWPCEAGGVTLAYHAGRPVGELLAAVDAGPGAFVESTPIGVTGSYEPPAAGTLYLRVNDAPNRLADNEGRLAVVVRVD